MKLKIDPVIDKIRISTYLAMSFGERFKIEADGKEIDVLAKFLNEMKDLQVRLDKIK